MAQRILDLLDLHQHAPHRLQVALACLRETHAARRALQQPHADALFERLHGARHAGRREVHLARGRGEAARVGDAKKDLHGIQSVHGMSSRRELRCAELRP